MKTVFVMLSGGVDSSVAAARLLDAGYDVRGIFMKNWSYDRLSSETAALLASTCPTVEDAKSAKAAADFLGIPFEVINFEEEYWNKVVEPFFALSAKGLTPNPDVWCNQYIKFGVFLDWALGQGADLVATGHYAQIETNSTGATILKRGRDPRKDQSYFLAHVAPEKLSHVLLPIGHLYKSQVRLEAATRGLPTATRKDSQGICFIGKVPLKTFLKERLPEKQGNVVYKGKIIGTHDGVWFYTIGQRHIGFNSQNNSFQTPNQKPLYIIEKDIDKNELIVGEDSGESPLWKTEFQASQCHWYGKVSNEFSSEVEIRYHQSPLVKAKVERKKNNEAIIRLSAPVRAVTPGQTVVFSKGTRILGAGIINEN